MSLASKNRTKGWIQLVAIAALISLVWLLILPEVAQTNAVRERGEFIEKYHINPAAMFYTELECIPDPSPAARSRDDVQEPE